MTVRWRVSAVGLRWYARRDGENYGTPFDTWRQAMDHALRQIRVHQQATRARFIEIRPDAPPSAGRAQAGSQGRWRVEAK